MRKEFLGRGWKFPFQFDPATGGTGMSEYEENIRQCITVILATKPGERQMLPEFGCRIHELMFAPSTQATATLIAHHVQKALERWEPRIEVLNLDSWAELSGSVRVQLNYKIRSTSSEQDLTLLLASAG